MTVLPDIPRALFYNAPEAGKGELFLQEDGKGLAFGGWERWKVSICNYFQSEKTVAMKKRDVVLTYLEAVRREDGMEAAYFAGKKYDELVANAQNKQGTTTAHPAIDKSLFDTLNNCITDALGLKFHNLNEVIESSAHRAGPPRRFTELVTHNKFNRPTLTDIVNPVVSALQTAAERIRLPKSTIDAITPYRVDYKITGTKPINIPGISDAIESAILSHAYKDHDGISSLSSNDACTTGKEAVKRFLTRKINALTYDNLVSEVTTAQALTARQLLQDPEDKAKTLVTPEQIEIEVRNAIGNIPILRAAHIIRELRDAVIDVILDPKSEKKKIALAEFYDPIPKTKQALPPEEVIEIGDNETKPTVKPPMDDPAPPVPPEKPKDSQ